MVALKIFPTPEALFHFCAKDFSQRAMVAVNAKGSFSVVLAGGNTPKLFFDTLVEWYGGIIPWQKIRFFFGDERYVPLDDIRSNYRMANEHLFSRVNVDPSQVYRIPTHFSDPHEAAHIYEKTLRDSFGVADKAFPLFDLVYLGLGEDAHTASLMPCSAVLTDSNNLVASLYVEESNMYRITLTPTAINHAQDIIFTVTGENKALAVRNVLTHAKDALQYPAQLIHSIDGETLWYLDKAAAGDL